MVLNDEGHHCGRPKPGAEDLSGEEKMAVGERVSLTEEFRDSELVNK